MASAAPHGRGRLEGWIVDEDRVLELLLQLLARLDPELVNESPPCRLVNLQRLSA